MLELTGALGGDHEDEWLEEEPTDSHKQCLEGLRGAAQARVHEAGDVRRLATALRWWRDFL
eukprot:3719688-Pleurochrysis_carterae.AAC.1